MDHGGRSRDDWIRTSGLFVPNEARYRAAPHPEIECEFGCEFECDSLTMFCAAAECHF